jgi:hypothetical protein
MITWLHENSEWAQAINAVVRINLDIVHQPPLPTDNAYFYYKTDLYSGDRMR